MLSSRSSKRKFTTLAVSATLLISTWIVYSRFSQYRREAKYRAAIEKFQRDFPVGVGRPLVEAYLHLHGISYNITGDRPIGAGDTYQIKIGEDPGSLVCDPWRVYVALEFDSADKLQQIHIKKLGTCL